MKVSAEQEEFMAHIESVAHQNHGAYNVIHPEAAHYVEVSRDTVHVDWYWHILLLIYWHILVPIYWHNPGIYWFSCTGIYW